MANRIDPIWEELDDLAWRELARAWLAEHGGPPFDGARSWPVALFGGAIPVEGVAQAVVAMNFTARAELQWRFILAALQQATTREELGHLTAGPLEHLLGWHGAAFIERVERLAAQCPKMLEAVSGLQRYRIDEDVWSRIRSIRSTHYRPADESKQGSGSPQHRQNRGGGS